MMTKAGAKGSTKEEKRKKNGDKKGEQGHDQFKCNHGRGTRVKKFKQKTKRVDKTRKKSELRRNKGAATAFGARRQIGEEG